jgi:hypothetical protein
MKLIKSKKAIVLLSVLVVVAISAIGAYAYFTSNASGNGSASVGTSTPLTILQTNTLSALLPNSAPHTVAFDIANAAGNGAQNLGKVTISAWVVTPLGSNVCGHDDFSVTAPASAVGTIADGATFHSAAASQPSIQLNDTGLNQDGCQGASLALTLSAAQGA